jgi:RsiW-degrading membrane proteinase PrsW (M82 family)
VEAAARCIQCRRAFPSQVMPTLTENKTDATPLLGVVGVILGLCFYVPALLVSFVPNPSQPWLLTARALLGAGVAPIVLASGIWLTRLRQHIKGTDYILALASGAVIGLGVALVLYFVVPKLSIAFGTVVILPVLVAAVEEAGKMLAIWGFLKRNRYPWETQGLLFGVLAGLGFAAAENTVYVLTAIRQGERDGVSQIVFLRMMVCVAQACWTGTLASMFWRWKDLSVQWTKPVLYTFAAVILIHALWDYQFLSPDTIVEGFPAVVQASIVCTLALFLPRVRHAVRSDRGAD